MQQNPDASIHINGPACFVLGEFQGNRDLLDSYADPNDSLAWTQNPGPLAHGPVMAIRRRSVVGPADPEKLVP